MIHPRRGDQIVFNGEIYNFQVLRKQLQAAGVKFRGHSDTEVLLHALVEWGPECIDRLEGMYAFGFFDSQKKQVLLARAPLVSSLSTWFSVVAFWFLPAR
jgi:asparagine synthase (glutamine-hydrolysing)